MIALQQVLYAKGDMINLAMVDSTSKPVEKQKDNFGKVVNAVKRFIIVAKQQKPFVMEDGTATVTGELGEKAIHAPVAPME